MRACSCMGHPRFGRSLSWPWMACGAGWRPRGRCRGTGWGGSTCARPRGGTSPLGSMRRRPGWWTGAPVAAGPRPAATPAPSPPGRKFFDSTAKSSVFGLQAPASLGSSSLCGGSSGASTGRWLRGGGWRHPRTRPGGTWRYCRRRWIRWRRGGGERSRSCTTRELLLTARGVQKTKPRQTPPPQTANCRPQSATAEMMATILPCRQSRPIAALARAPLLLSNFWPAGSSGARRVPGPPDPTLRWTGISAWRW
mmetsp:Transcript_11389/g.25079  ORF Transcript_11389/g.25079 Transcript_11389/m.25079 type:complete len:253 (+) Transcript_11389:656-1414(+)